MNNKIRNRDLPAFPTAITVGPCGDVYSSDCPGLTKLEYAAIEIAAGVRGRYPNEITEWSFDIANKLFDKLESES